MRSTFPLPTLALVTLVTSTGCATRAKALALVPTPPTTPTTEGYGKVLDSWVGADADRLLRVWGSPNATFPMTDGTLWTYVRSSSYTTNTYSTTTYSSLTDSLHTTTTGGDTVNLRCQTEFEIDESNKIVRWRWSGNACRVVPPPEPLDCTARPYAGRVYTYYTREATIEINLYLPQHEEDMTLTLSGRHLQYLDSNWSARQWIAVCEKSGRGPYVILYPQKKFIALLEEPHLPR
jgi:hypothetical protein